MTAADLVNSNLDLIAAVSKRLRINPAVDMESVGHAALYRAAGGKFKNFRSYARRAIRNALLNEIRAAECRDKREAKYQPERIDRDYTPLYAALDQLDAFDREIVSRRFGLQDAPPATFEDMALAMNLSLSDCFDRTQAAIARLGKILSA